MTVSTHDRTILRDLAKRVREIAAQPVMAERRSLWFSHNSLQRCRPMILVFPEGAWDELVPPASMQCEDDTLHGLERGLRMRIYHGEHLDDDTVIEPTWTVPRAVSHTGWGLEPKRHPSTQARGAWSFDPVIHNAGDLKKLKHPEVVLDEAESDRRLQLHQDLLGDILDVRQVGVTRISFHLMKLYTSLRGLEQAMMDMVLEPAMLHEAMSIFTVGYAGMVRQYVGMDLLSLNNDGAYHSSGGVGYTNDLPADDFDGTVRPIDMWASAEAQELAQVSPEMHREFSMDYERQLLEPFGLNGYGCCEDLTRKMEDVLTLPNIRRISISPWADVETCAEKIGRRAIFSWKPNPSMLVGAFDEDRVRSYIEHAVNVVAPRCPLEIILKDTHTCEHHPERFDRWTSIARDVVETERGR